MFFLKDNTLNYKKTKKNKLPILIFCVVCTEAINSGYLLKSENERIVYFSAIHFY